MLKEVDHPYSREYDSILITLLAVIHHGQICFSTERVIVHSAVAPRFKELLVQAFKSNDIPDNTAVTRSSAQHAADVLEDAKSKGVEFLLGGVEWSGPASLKPSIVVQPNGANARIVDEETFGPSVSLCKYIFGLVLHMCLDGCTCLASLFCQKKVLTRSQTLSIVTKKPLLERTTHLMG